MSNTKTTIARIRELLPGDGDYPGRRQIIDAFADLEQSLAAAEKRAFAVEEKGCPRCMSYQNVEQKLRNAESRAERLEALCRRVCDIRCTQQMELEIAALRAAKEEK